MQMREALSCWGLFSVAGLLAVATEAPGGDVTIPTYTDETDSRLVADAAVGDSDTSEKDFGRGDFDRDGDVDVVVGRRIGFNGNGGSPLPNTLFVNVGGVLTDMTALCAPDLLNSERTRDIVVADFDNDGWLDVMVLNGTSETPQLLMNQGENGGGWIGLTAAQDKMPRGFSIDAWTGAAGDLANDADGYPDVFVGVRTGTDRILLNLGAKDEIWQGFTDGSNRLGNNDNTEAVRSSFIVDVNGDGDNDIVEGVTWPTGAVRVLANDGAGMFDASAQTVFSGSAYNFGVGDLDGNGLMDFFGVKNGNDEYRENLSTPDSDTIVLGNLLTAPNSSGFGSISRVGDINNDGTDDFLTCDLDQEFPVDCARRLKMYVNIGESPYLVDAAPVQEAWTPNGTSDVALIDIDGDGDLDMFIGHCTGNSVFIQDGSPAVVGDIDGDGVVGTGDLILLLGAWGPCDDCGDCPADLDGDCNVGTGDLILLLGNWG